MSAESQPLFEIMVEGGEQSMDVEDPYADYIDTAEEPPITEEDEEIMVAYTHEAYKIFEAMHKALAQSAEAQ